jgi:autotransporter family porin
LRNGTTSPSPRATPTASPAAPAAPAFFGTLPPGAALPSGAQCARWVLARPSPENKGANQPFNHTTGQHVGSTFFPAGDTPQADALLAPRIDGDFTGTTSEILRWAACKWGISQDIVFAQAAVESWWNQTTLGDWDSDASACPPGHGLGADGKPGQCPQSYGILQNRYPFEQASWPGIGDSTAMNADTAYAIWRSCYDGYETWLNNVPHGTPYAAGDAWGCVGRWFAGRWHTAAAGQYVAKVQQYLNQRIWTTPDFQQPG